MILTGGALAITGTTAITTIGSGLTTTTMTVAGFLWNGSQTNVNFRDYQRRILKLDIADKIKITNKIISMSSENENIKVNTRLQRQLTDGLLLLSENIIQLNDTVEKALLNYRLKWFTMYRNIWIEEQLKDLETQVQILDNKLLLAIPFFNMQLKYDGL
jgi:hypothetical protein